MSIGAGCRFAGDLRVIIWSADRGVAPSLR
jgi:hypothetical protein